MALNPLVGFQHVTTHHCVTGSMRHVYIFNDHDLSDEMLLGIGSGGNYAVAAARSLVAHANLDAAGIVRSALEIAAGIDIYTNTNILVEELECRT